MSEEAGTTFKAPAKPPPRVLKPAPSGGDNKVAPTNGVENIGVKLRPMSESFTKSDIEKGQVAFKLPPKQKDNIDPQKSVIPGAISSSEGAQQGEVAAKPAARRVQSPPESELKPKATASLKPPPGAAQPASTGALPAGAAPAVVSPPPAKPPVLKSKPMTANSATPTSPPTSNEGTPTLKKAPPRTVPRSSSEGDTTESSEATSQFAKAKAALAAENAIPTAGSTDVVSPPSTKPKPPAARPIQGDKSTETVPAAPKSTTPPPSTTTDALSPPQAKPKPLAPKAIPKKSNTDEGENLDGVSTELAAKLAYRKSVAISSTNDSGAGGDNVLAARAKRVSLPPSEANNTTEAPATKPAPKNISSESNREVPLQPKPAPKKISFPPATLDQDSTALKKTPLSPTQEQDATVPVAKKTSFPSPALQDQDNNTAQAGQVPKKISFPASLQDKDTSSAPPKKITFPPSLQSQDDTGTSHQQKVGFRKSSFPPTSQDAEAAMIAQKAAHRISSFHPTSRDDDEVSKPNLQPFKPKPMPRKVASPPPSVASEEPKPKPLAKPDQPKEVQPQQETTLASVVPPRPKQFAAKPPQLKTDITSTESKALSPRSQDADTTATVLPNQTSGESKPLSPRTHEIPVAPVRSAAPSRPIIESKPLSLSQDTDVVEPTMAPSRPLKSTNESKSLPPRTQDADAVPRPSKNMNESKPLSPRALDTDVVEPAVAPSRATKPPNESKPLSPRLQEADSGEPSVAPARPNKNLSEPKPLSPRSQEADAGASAPAAAPPTRPKLVARQQSKQEESPQPSPISDSTPNPPVNSPPATPPANPSTNPPTAARSKPVAKTSSQADVVSPPPAVRVKPNFDTDPRTQPHAPSAPVGDNELLKAPAKPALVPSPEPTRKQLPKTKADIPTDQALENQSATPADPKSPPPRPIKPRKPIDVDTSSSSLTASDGISKPLSTTDDNSSAQKAAPPPPLRRFPSEPANANVNTNANTNTPANVNVLTHVSTSPPSSVESPSLSTEASSSSLSSTSPTSPTSPMPARPKRSAPKPPSSSDSQSNIANPPETPTNTELAAATATTQLPQAPPVVTTHTTDTDTPTSPKSTWVASNTPLVDSRPRVRALFDYEAQAEGQLSFGRGAVMYIIERTNEGYMGCEYNGTIGWVINTYVEEIGSDHPSQIRLSTRQQSQQVLQTPQIPQLTPQNPQRAAPLQRRISPQPPVNIQQTPVSPSQAPPQAAPQTSQQTEPEQAPSIQQPVSPPLRKGPPARQPPPPQRKLSPPTPTPPTSTPPASTPPEPQEQNEATEDTEEEDVGAKLDQVAVTGPRLANPKRAGPRKGARPPTKGVKPKIKTRTTTDDVATGPRVDPSLVSGVSGSSTTDGSGEDEGQTGPRRIVAGGSNPSMNIAALAVNQKSKLKSVQRDSAPAAMMPTNPGPVKSQFASTSSLPVSPPPAEDKPSKKSSKGGLLGLLKKSKKDKS